MVRGSSGPWTGTDKGVFAINTGVLSFLKSPDFEMPTDANTDNIYEVTVQATDETMKVGMKNVMVTVTNVDEAGTVSLSARRPQSATAFTAEISDPDGVDGDVTNAQWQWAKSGSRNGSYANIALAESATYIPKDADVGAYLRATVTYTDPEDSGKTAGGDVGIFRTESPGQQQRPRVRRGSGSCHGRGPGRRPEGGGGEHWGRVSPLAPR